MSSTGEGGGAELTISSTCASCSAARKKLHNEQSNSQAREQGRAGQGRPKTTLRVHNTLWAGTGKGAVA